MATNKKINPWDQQEDESELDHHRFLLYRDLGPDRSIVKAARVNTPTGSSISLCKKLSKKHSWKKRAVAWDINVMSNQRAEMRSLYRRRRKASRKIFLDALEMRDHATQTLKTLVMAADKKPSQALKAAELILRTIGYEPPAAPLEDTGPTLDPETKAAMLDALTDDERAALSKITAKMNQVRDQRQKRPDDD